MFNADITTGDYRPLDLQRRPFRLGPTVAEIDDGELIGGRRLAVWERRRWSGRWPDGDEGSALDRVDPGCVAAS